MVQDLQPLKLPAIDFGLYRENPDKRPFIIKQIHEACLSFGMFHVVNHGITESVIEEALKVNEDFFDLPLEMKEKLVSDDIYRPVRFGTVQALDQGDNQFCRGFLKLYAYPLEDFLSSWPISPPDYRDIMGRYTTEVKKLSNEIFGLIMESLNLKNIHLQQKFNHGMQMVAVNNYPPSPRSESNSIGIVPHSDHTVITILLQSCPGLHVMDTVDCSWKAVPQIKGSLQVILGDHIEVLSNGIYKSLLHRAVSSPDQTRFSVASLHSLAMDERVEPVAELVDESHPKLYRESSLSDFLKHLSSQEPKPYIETLKI